MVIISILLRAIVPHPPIIVADIGRHERSRVARTCQAMTEVAGKIAAADPDTIMLITPHGPCGEDFIPVMADAVLSGNLAQFGSTAAVAYEGDAALAEAVVCSANRRGLPVEMVSGYELDHGAQVPLWYLDQAGVTAQLVVLGIGSVTSHVTAEVGEAVAEAVADSGRRCVLIASGDLSHRLKPDAPLGFDPHGPEFDAEVMRAVAAGDVQALIDLPVEMVEGAGECGLRPILIAMGADSGCGEILSYEGEFGVGYMVAICESLPVTIAKNAIRECLGLERSVVEDASRLQEPRGVFVSLKKQGELRGCIGTIQPTMGCASEEIRAMARSAAVDDHRFPPVQPNEFEQLEVSVDILGPMEPVHCLSESDPDQYGVVVVDGPKRGVLLPALPGITDSRQQIIIGCEKAGIDPESATLTMYRFQVVRYH